MFIWIILFKNYIFFDKKKLLMNKKSGVKIKNSTILTFHTINKDVGRKILLKVVFFWDEGLEEEGEGEEDMEKIRG